MYTTRTGHVVSLAGLTDIQRAWVEDAQARAKQGGWSAFDAWATQPQSPMWWEGGRAGGRRLPVNELRESALWLVRLDISARLGLAEGALSEGGQDGPPRIRIYLESAEVSPIDGEQ